MIIHVIKPNGARFESVWPDNTTDDYILRQLDRVKQIFGKNQQVTKKNPSIRTTGKAGGLDEEWDDPTAPFAIDDPATIVAIGRVHGDQFVEIRRLKGPALPNTPSPEKAGKTSPEIVSAGDAEVPGEGVCPGAT